MNLGNGGEVDISVQKNGIELKGTHCSSIKV